MVSYFCIVEEIHWGVRKVYFNAVFIILIFVWNLYQMGSVLLIAAFKIQGPWALRLFWDFTGEVSS